jgi:acyl-CoA dehydrogenase
LFFRLSALVLLYMGLGGVPGWCVLALVTVLGVYLDDVHFMSVLVAILLLGLSLLLMFANPLRQTWITRPLLGWVRNQLPRLSETEREALKSGSVDWDGELFSGRPRWKHLLAYSHGQLSADERAFIEGPVDKLCAMIDDWKITHELFDLPREVWDFMGKEGFFGLVIPREFGGKGFSEMAHSEIVMRLSTRSVSAAVTVTVPMSRRNVICRAWRMAALFPVLR